MGHREPMTTITLATVVLFFFRKYILSGRRGGCRAGMGRLSRGMCQTTQMRIVRYGSDDDDDDDGRTRDSNYLNYLLQLPLSFTYLRTYIATAIWSYCSHTSRGTSNVFWDMLAQGYVKSMTIWQLQKLF
jgi:hypothetical protein